MLLAPAVVALNGGEPLPPPFDSSRTAWAALLAGTQVRTVVVAHTGREPAEQHRLPLAPHAAALSAILAAAGDQGSTAAMIAAVDAAARGAPDPSRFFDRLRMAFELPQ